MKLIPVILSGGAGSRLWPVSRELHPKPFIRMADGESLLQKAFLRGARLPGVKEILTVTNRELFFKTEDEFQEINPRSLPTSFILEPFGRNTAAAIAAATIHVAKAHGEHALLLVLPADHLIANQFAFARAVAKAAELARESRIVTFGIRPEYAETGYGYIEADGHRVLRFVEKPSPEQAKEYLVAGRFFWNSGMFCFSAGAMLREMRKHCPAILDATRDCLERSRVTSGQGFYQVELNPDHFSRVPEDSIDYAVMEKAAQSGPAGAPAAAEGCVAVVPCSIGWSDVGSWKAVGDLGQPDPSGNRIEGKAVLHDARNCYVQSNDRVVGIVGVDNLIVIDTPDALLVTDKSRAQDVKHIYTTLKTQGHETHKLHRTVHRPWGTYTVLEEGYHYKLKRIIVKAGASLSLQLHRHRSEHWVVVSGVASVFDGTRHVRVNVNESTFIPAGCKHRVENPGTDDLVMIEVQSGEYLGEDDIQRFDDQYGRTSYPHHQASVY